MTMTLAASADARAALQFVEALQMRFAAGLQRAANAPPFERTDWLRDGGRHGGGWRLGTALSEAFNRASINVSSVHYDDEPARRLGSATAISTIIHPRNALAPSVHMHISWTEPREEVGYWRVMADLNPATLAAPDKTRFDEALRRLGGEFALDGMSQGDKYFHIPALGRHRGVSHFYLEAFRADSFEAGLAFARAFGEGMVDVYVEILEAAMARTPTDDDRRAQLAYHTAYLLQVLTLDRGTTSGLLVHDQNDVGIMGSLPSFVDKALLASWAPRMPSPQDVLVREIVEVLPPTGVEVDTAVRARLAHVVRNHYLAHPEALSLQASGRVIPPTVQNHGQ